MFSVVRRYTVILVVPPPGAWWLCYCSWWQGNNTEWSVFGSLVISTFVTIQVVLLLLLLLLLIMMMMMMMMMMTTYGGNIKIRSKRGKKEAVWRQPQPWKTWFTLLVTCACRKTWPNFPVPKRLPGGLCGHKSNTVSCSRSSLARFSISMRGGLVCGNVPSGTTWTLCCCAAVLLCWRGCKTTLSWLSFVLIPQSVQKKWSTYWPQEEERVVWVCRFVVRNRALVGEWS